MNEQHRTTAPALPATMTLEDRLADTLALVQGGNYADATAEERHRIIADLVEAMSDDDVRAIGAKVEAQAVPTQTAPGSRPDLFSTAINPVALAGLSLQHMADLYDVCHTLMNVAAGIGCEPRFQDSPQRRHVFNPAGEQADLFHELATHCLAAIVDEAVERKPADAEEALVRAWLLARDGANMRDDFREFFRMVVLQHATMSNLRKAGEQRPASSEARESVR